MSRNGFSFLRLVTGLGITDVPPRERMFNLEIAQRWLVNDELQTLVPDPEATADLPADQMKKVMQAIIEDAGASAALRKHVAERFPVSAGKSAPRTPRSQDVIPEVLPACDVHPTPGRKRSTPHTRRDFAFARRREITPEFCRRKCSSIRRVIRG